MRTKILLATSNRGKIKEITHILEGLDLELVTLDDYPGLQLPPEAGSTFRENALIKARAASAEAGVAALADDSGLEVDFLGGRPGIYSARYAGAEASDRDNWLKLLKELEGVPVEKRTARFRCVVALVWTGGVEESFEGSLEGVIASEPKGTNGFGYDPVFFIPGTGKTAAELTPNEKNSLSHRAKALEKLKNSLEKRYKKS
ncbi:MAG TPA: XTP/dITP diphosphatase [Thermodesulfobacteriota bacterium]|nr:XTP/dITP diphosphatase [Thermodesulfobacteriota bacterium]